MGGPNQGWHHHWGWLSQKLSGNSVDYITCHVPVYGERGGRGDGPPFRISCFSRISDGYGGGWRKGREYYIEMVALLLFGAV